ncbi:MAG: hypothetical protein UHU19_07155 [Lachnospiraceae bacterium]|nr:hypothetical protein [Lachnospiraceae bacterium]
MSEYLFSINGIMNGAICDEGTVYKKNGKYYLQWVGLGTTRRISEKTVQELENSDLRIKEVL